MKILRMIEDNVNDRYVQEVVAALRDGEIVIVPTDSLYALACDVHNNQAIERICKIKSMKSAKTNLSMACSDISCASKYAKISNDLFKVIKRNLPGVFTFLVESTSNLPKAFKTRKIVGIRIVENKILRAIVDELGHPVFTTSVEGEDEDYRCEPEFLAQTYANDAKYVIDAGRSVNKPSTVVDCTGGDYEVVREGISEFIY